MHGEPDQSLVDSDLQARHDTTQAPASVTDARQQWITRYLNSRFLRLPEQVEVLVRDHHGRGEPG